MESVGAELGNGSLKDMAWVSLRCLTEPQVLETGLETLAKVLAEPAFNRQDLERNRQAVLAVLKQEKESPSAIASKAFYEQLYGDHPYASPSHGTEASIKALKAEDLRRFHQQYYVAENAIIAMVGDLELDQAKQLAERVVAGLPAGEHAPALPEPVNPGHLLTKHIDHPSSQTHIQIGMLGVKRGDLDYFPLYVGNHILGGSGLVSILSGEVREKRGLSYSVYSYFAPMRALGPFNLGAQTKNAKANEARQVMLQTLARYIEQGPTEKELKAAKDNISGGFPLKISSNKKIVEYLAMIGFYDLPLDHLDTLVSKVMAVTREQIRDAFQRRMTPAGLVTITVGKGESPSAHGG
jgi:zinc protease